MTDDLISKVESFKVRLLSRATGVIVDETEFKDLRR